MPPEIELSDAENVDLEAQQRAALSAHIRRVLRAITRSKKVDLAG